MLITRISPFSNKKNTMDIDIDEYQLKQWRNGGLIQDVMPHLTADEREFIMTGLTPEAWNEIFGEEDNNDNELSEEPGR